MLLKETKILKISPRADGDGDDEKLYFASEILRRGGLVAFPTETVYGLGANALNENAVSSIFAAKGRPQDNPLIVHVGAADEISKYAFTENNRFFEILKDEMPAPLTVILPKRDIIPAIVSGGLDSVGMRVPLSAAARKFIGLCGVPVAAPSANLSGKPSPTRAEHVIEDLYGRADVIIDGGECLVGVESTVVSLCGDVPTILRPGGFTREMLERLLGRVDVSDAVLNGLSEGQAAASPGMKYKHYAPKTKVILVKGSPENAMCILRLKAQTERCAILCFDGEADGIPSGQVISIGSRAHLESYASRLFDALRKTDEIPDIDAVYAAMPENTDGISLAIYNRMLRAAAFKVIDADKCSKA